MMRTTTDRWVCKFITCTRVPSGSVRCAAPNVAQCPDAVCCGKNVDAIVTNNAVNIFMPRRFHDVASFLGKGVNSARGKDVASAWMLSTVTSVRVPSFTAMSRPSRSLLRIFRSVVSSIAAACATCTRTGSNAWCIVRDLGTDCPQKEMRDRTGSMGFSDILAIARRPHPWSGLQQQIGDR
jgi:hypothetical protein